MGPFEILLEEEHSKELSLAIVNEVINNPDRMSELMECFFSDDLRICQRAAWPVGFLGEKHGHLLQPYVEGMIASIKKPKHNAIVRNVFRSFQTMEFEEKMEGPVFDVSMSVLLDVNEAIAARVFAMTTAANIVMKYPELAQELIPVIEEHLPHGSAGFKNRGAKLLKRLRGL